MNPTFAQAVSRQREASDPGISAWVSANAGTGKTKVLTDRLLRLLLDGVAPERLVAITFTRAAAAEMENRLFGELAKWAAASDEDLLQRIEDLCGRAPADPDAAMVTARQLLVRVLECPGGIRIQTIHAFCQSLLASFPLEAGLAPHFRALDEVDAATLRARARSGTLRAATRGSGVLGDAIRTVAGAFGEQQIGSALDAFRARRESFGKAVQAEGGIDGYVQRAAGLLALDPDTTAVDILQRAWARVGTDPHRGKALEAAEDLLVAGSQSQALAKAGQALQAWIGCPADPASLLERWQQWAGTFLTKKNTPLRKLPWVPTAKQGPSRVREETAAFLGTECRMVQKDANHQRDLRTFERSAALARLADDERRRYEQLKRNRVAVDYDDLLLRAYELLTARSASAWILYKLDGGVSHLLVDEAQDTAPAQWRVIGAIADEFFAGLGAVEDAPRTLFAVGDSKQSIYRFQGADPQAFASEGRVFGDRVRGASLPWKSLQLELSFRSTPAVLKAVDEVWNHQQMRLGTGETTTHVAHRSADYGRVEVWPPFKPRPGDPDRNLHLRKLARWIAEHIGALTRPQNGHPARYQPGDVMILVRKRMPFMPFVVRALREAEIPVAGVDRMRIVDQPPVVDLLQLARFLLCPHDDLALANVLKGPLAGVAGGLSEADLFALAHGREQPRLWDALRTRTNDRTSYRTVCDRLSWLVAASQRLAPFDLFSEVLDGEHGARSALLARLGPDAVDAIEEFLFQALEYTRRETPSLEHFIAWVESEDIEIKRDLEVAGGSVRIMTVHAAKGLEAPIVFLAEAETKPQVRHPVVWTSDGIALLREAKDDQPELVKKLDCEFREEEQREYERLLYVAMTRARDRVIVTSWQTRTPKEPGPWWSNLVREPLSDLPEIKTEQRWIPTESDDTGRTYVLEANAPEPAATAEAVEPEPEVPLPAWLQRPAPPERAAPPSRATTEHVSDETRSVALARGTLAHQLLERLAAMPPGRRRDSAAALAHRLAPQLAAEMRDSVCSAALDVLGRAEFAFMFGPDSRAEVRIAGMIDDQPVEGQIDRLVVTADEVTAVDFKTGRGPRSWDETPAPYRRQIADYMALLSDTYPGHRIRGMLLYIESSQLLVAPGS